MTTGSSVGAEGFNPTEPALRIAAVDVVRGAALFGVLLVNMYNFGATAPTWTDPSDAVALAVMQIVFETKAFRLFSLLFGFGITLQLLRAEARRANGVAFHFRRMLVLFIIGMGHALLYDGDVLMLYAEFGLIVLLVRRVPTSALLVAWLLLSLVFPVERAVRTLTDGPQSLPSVEVRLDQARQRQADYQDSHPYAVGSIGDVMAFNAQSIPPNPLDETSFLAMCLLGVVLGRRRVLERLDTHRRLIRRITVWGLSLGVCASVVEWTLRVNAGYAPGPVNEAPPLPQLAGDLCVVFGATALCLGYAAALVSLVARRRWLRLTSAFAVVGRFGLSVYLMQTLMFSTLFYGYGFGQGGRLGPLAVSLYAVAFFGIQVLVCSWWAARFRFGPAEWVWRSLSYLTPQPMRLAS